MFGIFFSLENCTQGFQSSRLHPSVEFLVNFVQCLRVNRPVSRTSITCKIMEAAVRETIFTHLKRNNVLSTRQFGFLGGRSTILQLLTFLDQCVEAISRGNVTDVVYLDFQKAFDTVPHKRLMVKLQAYGLSGVILNWINAFLNGRTQRVIVNGIASRKDAVLSGVPQGSVLGQCALV